MRTLAVLLLMSSTALFLTHAGDETGTTSEETTDQWIGKTREEIEALMGPASKVKRKKDGSVLLYRFDRKAPGSHRDLVLDPGSSLPGGGHSSEWRPSTPGEIGPTPAMGDVQSLSLGTIQRIEFQIDYTNKVVGYKVKTKKARKGSKEE